MYEPAVSYAESQWRGPSPQKRTNAASLVNSLGELLAKALAQARLSKASCAEERSQICYRLALPVRSVAHALAPGKVNITIFAVAHPKGLAGLLLLGRHSFFVVVAGWLQYANGGLAALLPCCVAFAPWQGLSRQEKLTGVTSLQSQKKLRRRHNNDGVLFN